MLGSVVPAAKRLQMRGSNLLIDQRLLHLPSAKLVDRRRCAETLRREPRGCRKSCTLMARGWWRRDLKDHRAATPSSTHTATYARASSSAKPILELSTTRKLWGNSWGNRGEVEKNVLDDQSPIQRSTTSNETPFIRLFRIRSQNTGRDKCASCIMLELLQIIAPCRGDSGPKRVLRHSESANVHRMRDLTGR